MPYQAQYAQMGSPKTAIDDLLNLDGEGEYQSQNIAKKYIRILAFFVYSYPTLILIKKG